MTTINHPESTTSVHVAYLINQYPAVSHSFIRREILALERSGAQVMRLALRPGHVVDEMDRSEQARTRYVLDGGVGRLAWALCKVAFWSPRRFTRALLAASRMAAGSDRPWPIHMAYLAEASVVCAWLREAKVQHLHAHFATNPAEIAMLAHLLGGPSYSFTAHGSDIMDRPAQVGLPATVGLASFVVAVCGFGKSQICKWVAHEHWSRIHVIRCGLDPGYGGEVPEPDRWPQRLVSVGRLSKEKGQLVLIEALRVLRERGRDVELVLVGDGPMRTTIEACVRKYGLSNQVHLLGAQDSAGVKAAIEGARAMVLSSLSEGLPVVIMEAMALGRPVVAPYLAGIPELVEEGRTGWLFPAADADKLAEALWRCLDAAPATLSAMARSGRAKVASLHDSGHEASKLLDLFKAAIAPNALT